MTLLTGLARHNPDADWAIRAAATMPMLLLAGCAIRRDTPELAERAIAALSALSLVATSVATSETSADLKRSIAWGLAARRSQSIHERTVRGVFRSRGGQATAESSPPRRTVTEGT